MNEITQLLHIDPLLLQALREVKSGKISVNDKGAVDCVIQARVETAIKRAGGEN